MAKIPDEVYEKLMALSKKLGEQYQHTQAQETMKILHSEESVEKSLVGGHAGDVIIDDLVTTEPNKVSTKDLTYNAAKLLAFVDEKKEGEVIEWVSYPKLLDNDAWFLETNKKLSTAKKFYGVGLTDYIIGVPIYRKDRDCAGCGANIKTAVKKVVYPCGTLMCVPCDEKHKETLSKEGETSDGTGAGP